MLALNRLLRLPSGNTAILPSPAFRYFGKLRIPRIFVLIKFKKNDKVNKLYSLQKIYGLHYSFFTHSIFKIFIIFFYWFFVLFSDFKCPICNKTVPSDDIECHLVMCLTRPRIGYNEDILTEDRGECPICFDDMNQGDTIARLPCLCVYHKR